MKTSYSFPTLTIWICLAVAGTAAPANAEVSLETITYRSSAIDQDTTCIVALPSPLKDGCRYPVLYLLHGATGNYRDWSEKTSVTKLLDGRDMIVVMPDGGPYGWYLDSTIMQENQYDSAISRDLVTAIDEKYPTITNRDGRGICGLSMGGHGAMSLAAKHPDIYSSASSLSGILNVSRHRGKWHLDDKLGTASEDMKTWKENSVYHLVDRFAAADVALKFDTGVKDATGAVEDNRRTHEALCNRRIVHDYKEYPGIHNWVYWGGHIGEHLDFHNDNFTTRAAGHKPLTGTVVSGPPRYTTATLNYEVENSQRDAVRSSEKTSKTIVLLGSSTFAGTTSNLFPKYEVLNRGIGADRLGIGGIDFGLLHRLYCSVFDVKPDAILINNGTNDLYHTATAGTPTVEEAADGMDLLIGRIRETLTTTPILIVSCHATREKSAMIAPFIKPYNELTRNLTDKYENVYYVDTYSPTVGDDTLLNPKYSKDGLHLNQTGYTLLGELSNAMLEKAGL